MAGERLTRWEKAKQDWPGFHLWPDFGLGAFGGVLGVGVLAALGFPWETILEVIVVAATAALAAVLYRIGQLAWAWLQAPMRLLTADVVAIREKLDAVEV